MGRKPEETTEERRMELYIPTWEEIETAKKERMDIIDMLMDVKNPKTLEKIKYYVQKFALNDIVKNPLTLDAFVEYLDFPMIVRLMDLFKNEEPYLLAKKQIDELCTRALEEYMNPEGGVVNE